ncbi:MAG: hypothetical protein HRT55_14685 [Colwellia sp.]|uniref:hypothetical protein n=1 Tax=Colwellia sp. TaxID=56799 RepID=UPI0025C6ED72|nr:hypothetical protein [Colwellia sp.]NQZ27551.1 hypothetical protein [Colwellia sp.]
MKNQKNLKRVLTISIVVVSVWLFWPSMPQQQQQQNITVNEPLIKTPLIEATKLPAESVNKNSLLAVMPEKITSNASAALVAKVYAAELNFPAYSQPLTDNDFDRLQPNHFNPQSIPVDDEGTQVTAALSKYRYTYPELVFATLTGENIVNAELQLVDTNTGNLLLTSKFEQDEDNWYAQLEGRRDLPRQLQATIKASVNGKNITIALALKYVDSIATLEGFNSAFNQDADMVMPANLTTREQGLYRIRANLFDANNQPIAHLVSKEKLNKGSSHINLKAHQSVLQGKSAPFYLSTFSIELMSPAPGEPTKYGNSAIKKYEIKEFSVSSLSDTPYQPSEQEQQRLLLLQNMAEGG